MIRWGVRMDELKQLIEQLVNEAACIQIQGRALRPDEMARVEAIHQAIPHLEQALEILSAECTSDLITYKIVSDTDGKLKQAARTACNFWNRFVIPKSSIIVRLGVFTSFGNTIARAYRPYKKNGVSYGVVEFNTKFLAQYADNQIAATIIHEIGHTLGFGWDQWMTLFDSDTGQFNDAAISALGELKDMRVETGYGRGTQYSHWSEQVFDDELMTGFKDATEHVLPVTIRIMRLLGHQVIEELPGKTDLNILLNSLAQIAFSRQKEAKALDVDHFEETEIWENIPHSQAI